MVHAKHVLKLERIQRIVTKMVPATVKVNEDTVKAQAEKVNEIGMEQKEWKKEQE